MDTITGLQCSSKVDIGILALIIKSQKRSTALLLCKVEGETISLPVSHLAHLLNTQITQYHILCNT